MRVMHWREKADVFCGFTLLPSGKCILSFYGDCSLNEYCMDNYDCCEKGDELIHTHSLFSFPSKVISLEMQSLRKKGKQHSGLP